MRAKPCVGGDQRSSGSIAEEDGCVAAFGSKVDATGHDLGAEDENVAERVGEARGEGESGERACAGDREIESGGAGEAE